MKLTKKKKILQMKILFSQIRFRLDLTDVIQNEYKVNNEANKERTVHIDCNLSGGRKLTTACTIGHVRTLLIDHFLANQLRFLY